MLKDFLYFDEDLIKTYGQQMSDDFSTEYTSISTEKQTTIGVNLPGKFLGPLGMNSNHSKKSELTGVLIKTISDYYNKFEKALNNYNDDHPYLDFLENNDLSDLTSVGRSIVRVEGSFKIPEEFDPMEVIEEHKKMLMEYSPMDDDIDNALMNKWFVEKENVLVPLILTLGDENIKAFTKVNKNKFVVDYNLLEEHEDNDLIFLFKSNGYKKINKEEKVVFNMVKDFFCIPRSVRRNILKEDLNIDGFKDITMKEDYLEVEILSIYK